MLVQKYYFDAEYSAVRNDREISINSFRKKEFLFVTRLLYKTIVMHCKITQGLCDLFSTNRRILHHGTQKYFFIFYSNLQS